MRILICDDDALIVEQLQKYIRNFFEKIGVKCPELVCFSDGESLLADKGEKDILFLDVEMPGMNGIYVGNELKKRNDNIIIFIVTSYSEYLDEAMRFHVFRYLSKPLDKQRFFRNFESIRNMQYWLELLPKNCFFQTHRSFIINFEHVTDFDRTLVHMADEQFHAYLTKRKYSAFKEAYLLYLDSTR